MAGLRNAITLALSFATIILCCSALGPVIAAITKSEAVVDVWAKCPHILTTSTLKQQAARRHDSSTLRVIVPWNVGSIDQRFVSFSPHSCTIDGFAIQVFLHALRPAAYNSHSPPPSLQFVLYDGSGSTAANAALSTHDNMIDILATSKEEVDAVVGGLTITRERMEKVGFTVPYLASSLVMVTPFRPYENTGSFWDVFVKTLSRELALAFFAVFVGTGITLYFLLDYPNADSYNNSASAITSTNNLIRESDDRASDITSYSAPTAIMPASTSDDRAPSTSTHHDPARNTPAANIPPHEHHMIDIRNPALQPRIRHRRPPARCRRRSPPPHPAGTAAGPPGSHKLKRLMDAFWFTSQCIFQSQKQDLVQTPLARIVTFTWQCVVYICLGCFSLSLSAGLLSAPSRCSTIEGFGALLKDTSITVGYPENSFVQTYIMDKLNMEGHKLKGFSSATDYAQALKDPNAGVGAVLDELPYVQILLQSEYCYLTISSSANNDHPLPSFGGFGFAFRKGDPRIDEVSSMILAMAADGTLQRLKSGWNIGDDLQAAAPFSSSRCDSSEYNKNVEPPYIYLRPEIFEGLFIALVCVEGICILVLLLCCCKTTSLFKSRPAAGAPAAEEDKYSPTSSCTRHADNCNSSSTAGHDSPTSSCTRPIADNSNSSSSTAAAESDDEDFGPTIYSSSQPAAPPGREVELQPVAIPINTAPV